MAIERTKIGETIIDPIITRLREFTIERTAYDAIMGPLKKLRPDEVFAFSVDDEKIIWSSLPASHIPNRKWLNQRISQFAAITHSDLTGNTAMCM